MADLSEELENMKQRLTALENKAPTPEEITAAIAEHPLIKQFRAFLDKWGNK